DKGLHYECNIKGYLRDFYYGDNMKLKQVMINILGNSVKFTEVPGQVTLTVEEMKEENGICTLRFAMKDTGVGMDEEYIPKIFEAFSQEDATATNRYGGSGLGMAITKNFVEMMNGDIHVESKKGVGSTFTVTVPLRPSDRKASEEESFKIPEGLRIAMVDDDEVSCEHAEMVLNDIGAKCDIFSSPEEALKVVKAAHDSGSDYGLVMTDYKMPGMTGLELTRKIREFDNDNTAVIMLTGYNWDIIEDEAMTEGVDGIIAKPLFADSLLREIHTVLMKRSGEEISEEKEEETELERNLAGRRVLMAEDVEQNAEILEDLLELEDISAEHALNGKIAVDMFAQHPAGYYDAILMDVRMPVMDGLTATREIRAMDRPDAKTIPIIAMTANVFDEDVERSRQAGMDAHLGKPVEPEKLYDELARLITEK
ncbi:MAG: response regulator, partial [Eubacterium sp.]|nr:response regulator [Eubacterium sp.]